MTSRNLGFASLAAANSLVSCSPLRAQAQISDDTVKDRRACRHVWFVLGSQRNRLGCRCKDGRGRFWWHRTRQENRGCFGRSSEQAGHRLQHRAPMDRSAKASLPLSTFRCRPLPLRFSKLRRNEVAFFSFHLPALRILRANRALRPACTGPMILMLSPKRRGRR